MYKFISFVHIFRYRHRLKNYYFFFCFKSLINFFISLNLNFIRTFLIALLMFLFKCSNFFFFNWFSFAFCFSSSLSPISWMFYKMTASPGKSGIRLKREIWTWAGMRTRIAQVVERRARNPEVQVSNSGSGSNFSLEIL